MAYKRKTRTAEELSAACRRAAIIVALSALLASVAGADIPQGDGTRYLKDSTVRQWEACAWKDETLGGANLTLKYPSFVNPVNKGTLFQATAKSGEYVCLAIGTIETEFEKDDCIRKLKDAPLSELRSPSFLRQCAKKAAVFDPIWACGIEVVNGRNAFWMVCPMTRYAGDGSVLYKGVQKSYIFWNRGEKFAVANYCIGVYGNLPNHPIDDFRAVSGIGEKFVKSIRSLRQQLIMPAP